MSKTLGMVVLWSALAISAQAVTLEWKFTPGDAQSYHVTQSARLSADSIKQIAAVKQELDLTWQVVEVNDDGSATISLRVSAFSFLATGPDGQEVRYDSDSNEEPQGYAAMLLPIGKRLSEAEVQLTMTSRGEVSDVKLPDELSEAVKSVPGGKKFAQDGGLKSFESLARLGAPLLLPEGDIATGASWTEARELELPVLGPIKAEFAYVLRNPLNRDLVNIDQMMTIDLEAQDDAERLDLVNQNSSGTLEFDTAAGRPETSTLIYEAEFEQPNNPTGQMKLEHSIEFRRMADDSQ
ncbi:MAG: hypothetical protein SH868_01820 [Bythopirellula sp.]|nr:hypothetical protein [Bythopirellula sp.]